MANDSMVSKNAEPNKASEDSVDYESVLAFLRKRGLRSTEEILLNELRGNKPNSSATGTGNASKFMF
jgi:hypothetical protein